MESASRIKKLMDDQQDNHDRIMATLRQQYAAAQAAERPVLYGHNAVSDFVKNIRAIMFRQFNDFKTRRIQAPRVEPKVPYNAGKHWTVDDDYRLQFLYNVFVTLAARTLHRSTLAIACRLKDYAADLKDDVSDTRCE